MPTAPIEALERLGQELASPAPSKRMLIIVNPYATTVSDRLRHLVVYALRGRFDVEAVDTDSRGHATEICREAALEGYDVVVAFGGDGTVNEAANGLAGSTTPLCCLPGGATNVYCRMLGIPPEIVDATEHLLRMADDWRPRQVDLGQAAYGSPDGERSRRYFTFSSGFGLDASVVQRVDEHPRMKARGGALYYTSAGVTTYLRKYFLNPPKLEVTAGDERWEGVTAIVQNGDPFTYYNRRPIEIARGAALDGGTLAGAVLHRANPIDVPTLLWRAFTRAELLRHRQLHGFSDVTAVRAASTDGRVIPLQVDGDYLGDVTEVEYGIAPGRLAVVS